MDYLFRKHATLVRYQELACSFCTFQWPEGGCENPSLRYHIRVDCKKCNREILGVGHLPLYLCAAKCIRRGGKPITDEGEEMAGGGDGGCWPFSCAVHKKIKLFYFWWMCRKDDGSGELVGAFSVGKSGDCAFRVLGVKSDDEGEILEIKGIKGWFQVTRHGKKRWRDSGSRRLPGLPRLPILIQVRRIQMTNSGALMHALGRP